MKIGDVVQLKSCGPDMTITAIVKDTEYECKWFFYNEEADYSSLGVGYFHPDALVAVNA